MDALAPRSGAVGDGTLGRAADEAAVLGEHPALHLPGLPAAVHAGCAGAPARPRPPRAAPAARSRRSSPCPLREERDRSARRRLRATCPTTSPWVAPRNRPSVISPTVSPSPVPIVAEVADSISRMPGPPFGPSSRITTTSPGRICRRAPPSAHPSSPSKTRAGPVITGCFTVIFATAPSVARLPRRIARWP